MPSSRIKSPLGLGIAVSVTLHALAVGVLYLGNSAKTPVPEPTWVELDIEEAPEPPEAHMPKDEAPEPPPEPAIEDKQEEAAEITEPEPALPDPDGVAVVDAGRMDAGVIDAGVADAGAPDSDAAPGDADSEARTADAGPGDAMLVAQAGDAGASDAGQAVAAHSGREDAGMMARAGDAGTRDSGQAVAARPGDAGSMARIGDAGAATASMDTGGGAGAAAQDTDAGHAAPYPGADANLLAYFPRGEVIAVMLRFDRLRGTPWAQKTAAILAPMPDYRALIGRRDVPIADLFDTLLISSSRPRDATATTLVGHSRLSGPEVRAFINHADAPVSWSTARGGPLGRRLRSNLVHPADQRVFLMPYPGWVVLSHPAHLGALTRPAQGDMNTTTAAAEELPPWLAGMGMVEAESGVEHGPALIVTIAGMLPPVYKAPYMGEIVMPERLSLALEVAPQGFLVRGNMRFAGADKASRFVAAARRAQTELVSTRVGKLMLARVNAYHALRGLSLKQNRDQVGFATSISIADARAMMDLAGRWSQSFFLPETPGSGANAPDAGPPGDKAPATRDENKRAPSGPVKGPLPGN